MLVFVCGHFLPKPDVLSEAYNPHTRKTNRRRLLIMMLVVEVVSLACSFVRGGDNPHTGPAHILGGGD